MNAGLLMPFFIGWLAWVVGCFVIGLVCDLIVIADKLHGNLAIPDEAFDYNRRPDFIPEDAFLLDTHSHTNASDGVMTPEQNIKWHIANGFDAFVVTDHNTSKNNAASLALQEKYPGILIIPGFEWTTPKIHLNFIGIEDYPWAFPSCPATKTSRKPSRPPRTLEPWSRWITYPGR